MRMLPPFTFSACLPGLGAFQYQINSEWKT
jgi:hypothetical protein